MSHRFRIRYVIYLITLLYSAVQAGVVVLVPLYAAHLQQSAMRIGLVVAFQALLQVALRLPAGFVCHRVGERWILALSHLTMALTCALLWISSEYAVLLVAQLAMGLSRAVFWVPVQAYVSRLEETGGGERLGWAQGLGSVGQVMGPFLAGVALEGWEFKGAFFTASVVALMGTALVPLLPRLPLGRDDGSIMHGLAGELKGMVRHRSALFAGSLTFTAALVRGIVSAFFPVYLDMLGVNKLLIGALTSLRGLMEVIFSWFAGWLADRQRHLQVLASGFALTVAGFLGLSASPSWFLAGVAMGLVGAGASALHVHGLVIGTQFVAPDKRGLAVGVNGTFWAMGLLLGPLGFGGLVQFIGMAHAMALAGAWLAGAWAITFRGLQRYPIVAVWRASDLARH